ncbi:DUF460 domain-containing protein [Methanolacinia paynteri]|uniref:DUF460 domain-containing protein n=1 Tax=Methanolacinia paynteri TaxID=230356 RepID=UPI00064E1E69|nr:DUF460 domain-containing protein [Methanolacinia paynteri]
MKVFGIDVIKGSVRSRTKRPVFAVVVRENDGITEEGEMSLFRVLRRIASEKPDILAVDSLQEISRDHHDLYSVLGILPPETRLVQVTGGEKQVPLAVVAARYNLKFNNKFDPFVEARTIAHVAELGGGYELIAFGGTTDIIVSRHRSIGKGGWSQNRYIRKIHGSVQQKAVEVEDALKEAILRYERIDHKGYGGLRRVEFHVHAPREHIPVSEETRADVQVNVSARRLDRIHFRPQHSKKRNIIVGVDPGTTVGIAALDLDGNLVELKSSRQMSINDWIEEISALGKPVLIASDVAHMPSSVDKIRRSFHAAGYNPPEDRTQEEKVAICSGFSYANDHERDSLAAAIEAYRTFNNKFKNIEKRIPAGFDLDTARAGIIRGLSIEQIVADSNPRKEPVAERKTEEPTAPESKKDPRISQLEGMVRNLREYVSDLQDELAEKEREIDHLGRIISDERSGRFERIKRDSEIEKRDATIKSLKSKLRKEEKRRKKFIRQIKRMKNYADLQNDQRQIPVKVVRNLTRECVRSVDDEYGIGSEDILYIEKTGGWGNAVISFLRDAGVCAVITPDQDQRLINTLRHEKIPLLSSVDVPVATRGSIGFAFRKEFDQALEKWKEGQEIFEKEKSAEMIESIVSEYRSERELEARRHGRS